MDKSPSKPCDKAVQSHLAALQNCIALANNRHVTFIEVTKRLEPIFADNFPGNQFSDVMSLLHRYLGNARLMAFRPDQARRCRRSQKSQDDPELEDRFELELDQRDRFAHLTIFRLVKVRHQLFR